MSESHLVVGLWTGCVDFWVLLWVTMFQQNELWVENAATRKLLCATQSWVARGLSALCQHVDTQAHTHAEGVKGVAQEHTPQCVSGCVVLTLAV